MKCKDHVIYSISYIMSAKTCCGGRHRLMAYIPWHWDTVEGEGDVVEGRGDDAGMSWHALMPATSVWREAAGRYECEHCYEMRYDGERCAMQ